MAEQELSVGKVKDRIEAIFAPYRIEFEISDFGFEVKFTVCDDMQERSESFTYNKANIDYLMPSLLDHSLQTDREALRQLGYEFD